MEGRVKLDAVGDHTRDGEEKGRETCDTYHVVYTRVHY
jgi:hypothetical protein